MLGNFKPNAFFANSSYKTLLKINQIQYIWSENYVKSICKRQALFSRIFLFGTNLSWTCFQIETLLLFVKSISFSFKTLCPHYVIVKVIFKSDVYHIKYYILKVNNDKLQCIPCFLFDCKFQHALTKINSNPLKKKKNRKSNVLLCLSLQNWKPWNTLWEL